jgi:oligoendopeptidase F
MRAFLSSCLLAAFCLVVAGSAFGQTGDVPERKDIDPKYKWRLEDIYATDQAWESDFAKLEKMLPDVGAYKGRLGESGAVLLDALRKRDEIGLIQDRLVVFAGMRYDEDTRIDKYAGMRDRINTLGSRLSEAGSYFVPEVLQIPREQLWKMVDTTKGLELYRHHLDDIVRGAAHTLSANEEALLAAAGPATGAYASIFGAFQNSDIKFGTMKDESGNEVELSQGRYYRFQESSDRRVREESWKLFYKAYREYGRTLAANMSGNIKSDVFYARARKYDSALEASLDANAIPVSVYKNIIKATRDNIQPLHRYVAMRKQALGVDTLRTWDMAAPLAPRLEKQIAFDDALTMVTAGLQPLGPEYLTPFKEAFNQGWVDVYETQGKRGGAYSWGSYSTKPYLLLNYNGTLNDAFTLGHEMGHSMHSYFARKNQPYIYGGYSLFVAEVASTTNEALIIEKMLKETTDHAERIALLNHYLEQIRGTFFTQIMFADFELQMHEMVERGEPLTKEALDKAYQDTYAIYFGPSVVSPELNGATWSRIPHFYRNFYVFQYATAYAAATALSQKILDEGKPAVDGYLAFLKAGSSEYPIDVLKKAGVDLTTPAPFVATIQTFDRLVTEMETELAKGK